MPVNLSHSKDLNANSASHTDNIDALKPLNQFYKRRTDRGHCRATCFAQYVAIASQ